MLSLLSKISYKFIAKQTVLVLSKLDTDAGLCHKHYVFNMFCQAVIDM